MAQTTCQRCGRAFLYHCCGGPFCMPCPHCGFDEADLDPAFVPTVGDGLDVPHESA